MKKSKKPLTREEYLKKIGEKHLSEGYIPLVDRWASDSPPIVMTDEDIEKWKKEKKEWNENMEKREEKRKEEYYKKTGKKIP